MCVLRGPHPVSQVTKCSLCRVCIGLASGRSFRLQASGRTRGETWGQSRSARPGHPVRRWQSRSSCSCLWSGGFKPRPVAHMAGCRGGSPDTGVRLTPSDTSAKRPQSVIPVVTWHLRLESSPLWDSRGPPQPPDLPVSFYSRAVCVFVFECW